MSKPSASRRRIFAFCMVPVLAIVAVALLAVSPKGRGAKITAASTPLPTAPAQAVSKEQAQHFQSAFAALPLAFEQNQGQTDGRVRYLARANGYTLFLTNHDAVFSFSSKAAPGAAAARYKTMAERSAPTPRRQKDLSAAVHMRLAGGNQAAEPAVSEPLPGITNYYIGDNPKNWHAGVPQYARVSYKDVYPGVDLAYYGQQSRLEFDFIVAPNANPAPIDLAFSGAQKIATDGSGNLVVSSAAGNATLHKPVAYQMEKGARQVVDANFVVKPHHQVGLALGAYDHSRELVIDPSVTYSTYLGGNAEDEAYAIAVDASGNAYITGATKSPNFPGPLAAGPTFDVFASKLNAAGTALVYSTLLGGNGDDFGLGIAVNSTGTYVAGSTNSSNFPAVVKLGPVGGQDAFVAKLDSTTGAHLQVTTVGGASTDTANGIAVDSTGATYVGGETFSTNFPTTASPIQGSNKGADDGFVFKLNSTGTALTYSTYLGGTSGDLVTGIALDGSNNAYVTGITVSSDFPTTTGAFQTSQAGTGDNAFVSAIKADGSALIYSTYLGGNGVTDALAIAVDPASGEAYVTGDTNSSAFPTVNPAQASLKGATDVFVTKFLPDGSGLLFSTYFGGSLDDTGTGIALDSFNDVYVTGRTMSMDYPASGSPFQSSLSGTSDAFVTELSNTGFTVYSSYLGGMGNENSVAGSTAMPALGAVAVDSNSNAYLAGSTASSSGFPVTSGVLQPGFGGGLADGFVTKVAAAPADFSVAVSPTSITTTAGQTTATITVTVSSVNSAYGNAVTLSCGGKPAKSACDFSMLSVTPGPTAVTSNLTITTNGTTGNGMLTPPMGRRSIFYALLVPVFGLAFAGAGLGGRKRKAIGLTALTLMLALLIVLPACGGGSSGGGGGGGGGNNTAPGTYALTVTGSAGGAVHSVPLKLTVQ